MNIPNYYKYDEMLSAGAQPDVEHFTELKEKGVDVVINLSPASTKNAVASEPKIVDELNMEYIHHPVDCSNLKADDYINFKEIMNRVEHKKIFIHCGGNIKSSNLIHMYHVLEKKTDEKTSFQTLLKIQNPEKKWIAYFQTFGMKGNNF